MKFNSVHIQVDKLTDLGYLFKMGKTKSQQLLTLLKEIWEYLFKHQIIITAECLPGVLNHQKDLESRNQKDTTEWKLCPQIFKNICHKVEQLGIICLLLGCRINSQHINLRDQIPKTYLCLPTICIDTQSAENRVRA